MSFERRSLDHGGFALVATSLERAGFLAAFTERGGGTSDGSLASLNLSQVVGDDPMRVRANRDRVVAGLGLGGPFALPEQVHGSALAAVDAWNAGAGYDDPGERLGSADAVLTSARGLPVAVLTADCLPVAIASPSAGLLAVVHAGWRGLASGILAEAVAAFEGRDDVLAAVGPAIGPDHYEVGGDVVERVEAGAGVAPVTERRDGRMFLDLAGTAEAALRSLGVAGVEVARVCTASEPERFYSHRRDAGNTGRQALVAVRR